MLRGYSSGGIKFLLFEDARRFVRSQGIPSKTAWEAWNKAGYRPPNIPSDPPIAYAMFWHGWGDWLGTGAIANQNRSFLPFPLARAHVRALGFKSQKDWRRWAASPDRPPYIPNMPEEVYEDEYISCGDWIGTGTVATKNRIYIQFAAARQYVQSLGFKNQTEWKAWTASGGKPDNIPFAPWWVYKTQWNGWGDWLGTGNIASYNRIFLPFEEARAFVHTQNLYSISVYRDWIRAGKKPPNIPSAPDSTYKENGWRTWGDWLGTDTIATKARNYLAFTDACAYVQTLGLKNQIEWSTWAASPERPPHIPSTPAITYKEDWKGIRHWLGTHRAYHGTNLERLVQDALDRYHIMYETQKLIGRYRIDFFIPPHTLLECDGTYWHARPETQEKDARRDAWLEKKGYVVIRLAEEDIEKDVMATVSAALDLIEQER